MNLCDRFEQLVLTGIMTTKLDFDRVRRYISPDLQSIGDLNVTTARSIIHDLLLTMYVDSKPDFFLKIETISELELTPDLIIGQGNYIKILDLSTAKKNPSAKKMAKYQPLVDELTGKGHHVTTSVIWVELDRSLCEELIHYEIKFNYLDDVQSLINLWRVLESAQLMLTLILENARLCEPEFLQFVCRFPGHEALCYLLRYQRSEEHFMISRKLTSIWRDSILEFEHKSLKIGEVAFKIDSKSWIKKLRIAQNENL